MAISTRINELEQTRVVKFISSTFEEYKKLLSDYHKRMLDVYKEFSSFTQPRLADWKTTFKVNKAHEVVNKILPRIMSKNPKWLVSSKPDILTEVDRLQTNEEKKKRMGELTMYETAVGDYLTHIFDKYNLIEPARLWAKNMIIYGNALAKIKFKYEIGRNEENEKSEETIINAEGVEELVTNDKAIKEYVWGEYPTIENKSRADVYYDPRYRIFDEAPAVIEYINGVRFGELKRNKKKYINLDKIEALPDIETFQKDPDGYKQQLFAIAGIESSTITEGIDKNALHIKTYYGLYDLDSKGERMYKISVVNDVICICFEEISQTPYEMIRCFEDTETMLSWGFVEPIIGLQQELNFKKNSASEYINHSLNRSWIWNPNSGINPKDLISKPNGIIPTNKPVEEAMKNLQEIPHRQIDGSYFNEQNDFERQIQAMTFTVDTSNPKGQQALTNTATGARIKFFESNSVIEEVRKHFEQGMQKLAYKLLNETFENMDDNIVIKKNGDEGFREINKELLKNAIKKYEIRVEIGSSSYDSIDDRREDAIAKYNLGLQAKQAGVPVDLTKLFKSVMGTFEDKEDYLENQQMNALLGGMQQQGMPGGQPLPQPQQLPGDAAALTEQVGQGGIVAGMGV